MSLQLHLVFLVLLAAVMHATWNAIVKTSGDRFLTATCNLGTGTFLGVFLLPLVPVPSAEVWPYLIVSVAVHCASYLFLIGAYRFGDLSHVYRWPGAAPPFWLRSWRRSFLEGIPFLAWTALRHRKHVAPFLRREWKQALTGGLLAKLGYGLVLYALAQGAMAHVSALRETSVLFAALIGSVLLKEPFGIKRAAAAAVIAIRGRAVAGHALADC